jgi:hypothetical protein
LAWASGFGVLALGGLEQQIQGRNGLADGGRGDGGIAGGGIDAGVAEEGLDDAGVGSGFQQVSSEGVAPMPSSA